MTVRDAIREADALRPNAITDGIKVLWLNRLEADICEMTRNPVPAMLGDESELTLKDADEGVYVLYLASKIDDQNMDTTLYANDAAAFNAAYAEAKARFRRHNRYNGKDIEVM